MNLPVHDLGSADFTVSIRLIEYGPGGQKSARRPSFARTLNLSPEATPSRRDPHRLAPAAALMLSALLVLVVAGFFTLSLMASPADKVALDRPKHASSSGLALAKKATFPNHP